MKRRDFLKYSSAFASVPLLMNGQSLYALGQDMFLNSLTSMRPDRKLILVQLNGGNDGLGTFVPLDQFDNLQKARSNIIIAQNKLISFTDTIGIHPYFPHAKTLFDEENLLLIQNVGYPEPNLSHFRSKDIVTTGSASDVVLRSGWMGRMLNDQHPDYPEGYPNESSPHPIALTIGSSSSQTCQGYSSNLSAVIKNLDTQYTSPGSSGTFPETAFGDEMRYISNVMKQTEVYLDAIAEAASKANNLSTRYPESDNSLSDQFKSVARLIAGGLQTQVYVVSLGGWDTHSGQTLDGTPEDGKHRTLLSKLSDALYAFQDDLKLLGIEDDVIGLVFSEFGRRIKSNDSFGTDHGTAWPAMLFGSQINPTVLGSNPVIPDQVEKNDNLPMQFDFRSVYASVFKEWFEAEDAAIQQVLFDQFEVLPILKREPVGISSFDKQRALKIYPNPVQDHVSIEFEVEERQVAMQLFSSSGRKLDNLFTRSMAVGKHQVTLDLSYLPAGSYYLGYINGHYRKSIPFIKL